jgi:ABC-2 family transporter
VSTAVTAPLRQAVTQGSARANTATITARNLRRLTRVPTLMALATLQPILFVTLFTYALGGAVHIPGTTDYIDYLLPGIFVLAIGFGASQTGVAIAEDLATGMIDRLRSLPIASASVLAGRVAADAVRNLFVVGSCSPSAPRSASGSTPGQPPLWAR